MEGSTTSAVTEDPGIEVDANPPARGDATPPPRRPDRALPFALLVVALLAALVALHITQVLRLNAPQIFTDEGGYLANARYLASGYGRNGSYYSGYSLFLVPAAWVRSTPLGFYHAALVSNAVLSALSPLLALLLVRELHPKAPRWIALLTAGFVAFAPLAYYFVGLTMSENAILPTTLAVALLLVRAARTDELWARLGAAGAGAFAYWISPRGAIVTAATLVALVLLTFDRRRSLRSLVPDIGTLAVVALLGRSFNHAVTGTSHTAGYDGLTDGLKAAVTHPHNWAYWLGATLGRFAYLGVASAGLTIIGLLVATRWLLDGRPKEGDTVGCARRAVAAFALISVVVTLVADAARVAGIRTFNRIDHVYFGRYNEVLALPLLVIGASWLLTRRKVVQKLAIAATVGGALVVALLLVRVLIPHPPANHPVMPAAVPAWLPFHWFLHIDTLWCALLVGSLVAAGALALLAAEPRIGGVILLVVAGATISISQIRDLEPSAIASGRHGTLVPAVQRLARDGVSTKCMRLDDLSDAAYAWYESNYRFLLPHSTISRQPPGAPYCGPLVVSSGLTYANDHPTARLVGVENDVAITIWLDESHLTPATRAKVEADGLVGPSNPCSALPEAAYSASIDASVALSSGKPVTDAVVDVTVRHTGAGAPWLGALGQLRADRCGQVSIVATVLDAQQQPVYVRMLPLPRTVWPGDEVRVHANLEAPGLPPTSYGVRAGRSYTVRFALVQQGIRPFGGPGGQGVVRPLHT